MTIAIYKDDAANAIFIEDANGVQFLNSLQATVTNGACNIHDLAKNIQIVTEQAFSEFVDQNGLGYGSNETEVCNSLNAIFSSSGTPTNSLPVITSGLQPQLTQGATLNYELTADFGVGYEWDLSNVPGITTVEGNNRKLIGGSALAVGSYSIPVKAINYNGEDSKTITLTVDQPPFSDTKSIRFSNQDYLGANASLVEDTLGRAGSGAGSGDAWTIAFWYKGSTANQGQTILYFGSNDVSNGGYIELRQVNASGQKRLRFRYGSNNNRIQLNTPIGSITPNTWQHILITYDGGSTGSSSDSMATYYSRFKIFIDNIQQSTSNSHSNYGFTGPIVGQNWRIGRQVSGAYMRDANVNEPALWNSDQSANAADLYGGGATFDLMTLPNQPRHWWRAGDGDQFPLLEDSGTQGNCTFVMYNMTSSDIVSDVP